MEFQGGTVVDSFLIDEVLEFQRTDRLWDVFPTIYQSELYLLDSWKRDYRARRIPFIVTQESRGLRCAKVYTMWKECLEKPKYRRCERLKNKRPK